MVKTYSKRESCFHCTLHTLSIPKKNLNTVESSLKYIGIVTRLDLSASWQNWYLIDIWGLVRLCRILGGLQLNFNSFLILLTEVSENIIPSFWLISLHKLNADMQEFLSVSISIWWLISCVFLTGRPRSWFSCILLLYDSITFLILKWPTLKKSFIYLTDLFWFI